MEKVDGDRKFYSSDKNRNINDGVPGVERGTKHRRRKGDPIKRSLEKVKELGKFTKEEYRQERLPYGHVGWIAKKSNQEPVSEEILVKYKRGEGVSKRIQDLKIQSREKDIEYSIEQAARAEILLTEDTGFLETEDGETSTQFTQTQIQDSIDITSAAKHFQLVLEEFGPYRINYTRNGRYLLLGGRKGHVAAFDWITKKPSCEINVMEELFDVQWLHNELMFAVAQKKWVYIYDNQGIEIHCVKKLHNVTRLEFLPYHFLLASCNSTGFLTWLDVSIGKVVQDFNARQGRLNLMTQNPYNAVICLAHANGSVTMWSPNSYEPLVKMLCHKRPIQGIAVNSNGKYMATSAVDGSVKIWDLRQLDGPLQDYRMHGVARHLAFSDRSALALSLGNTVEVYRDCCQTTTNHAYLRHKVNRTVADIKFCPFEDVLGIGSGSGFTSMIIPGAGEPNFDALEINPYQSRKQRQEAEVKSLLEKIQPELITLNPYDILEVDTPTLKDKVEAKQQLMLAKPLKMDFAPRRSGKFKGTVRATKVKKIVQERGRQEFVKTMKEMLEENKHEDNDKKDAEKPYSVLDRFVSKKKK